MCWPIRRRLVGGIEGRQACAAGIGFSQSPGEPPTTRAARTTKKMNLRARTAQHSGQGSKTAARTQAHKVRADLDDENGVKGISKPAHHYPPLLKIGKRSAQRNTREGVSDGCQMGVTPSAARCAARQRDPAMPGDAHLSFHAYAAIRGSGPSAWRNFSSLEPGNAHARMLEL